MLWNAVNQRYIFLREITQFEAEGKDASPRWIGFKGHGINVLRHFETGDIF